MKLSFDHSFVAVSEVTERTTLVAESFGLGLDSERNFDVLNGAVLDIRPADIVYIIGDSGGGKSTLLSLIKKKLDGSSQFSPISEVLDVPQEEILIEGAGSTFEDALRNLSIAGLNDAFLMIRKFKELSDGQKYRYKIAKLLGSGAKTWLFDEFLSTLDRDTAKVVSYCLQKAAKRLRKTLIAATTHEDLLEDLNPSVLVRKGFGSGVETTYSNQSRSLGACSLWKDIGIREGIRDDYQKLHMFHYRAELPNTTRKIYSMLLRNKDLIGVIAYGAPPLHASGRTRFLGYSPAPEEINNNFISISRVVVHPKFRGIGLGAQLVKETLPLVQVKYVETMAVMAKFNPFFDRAGMTRVDAPSDNAEECRGLVARINALGLGIEHIQGLDKLPAEKYDPIANELARSANYFALRDVYGHGSKIDESEVLLDLLSNRELAKKLLLKVHILSEDKAYFVWRNEDVS